jgi:PAS domain S-box-containing protein
MIRHKLDAEGVSCDITLVRTKDAFEAALTQETFDLILSDHTLPGYDGVAALTYAQQTRPDVPVILVSGTVGDEGAVRCLHLGATDYLLKDRLERLGSAAKRAIQEAEVRRTRMLVDAQRERFAALVEASPDFIGYADPKTTQIKYINKGGRTMCGIGEDEDVGTLKLGDVHPAWMNQQLVEVALPAAERDGVWQGDGAFLHRDGREIPVSMALLAHRGADGDVDFFYTVSRDITERKAAEVGLQQLAAIVEAADDAIISKTLDGMVLTWNPAAERLFGYRADEIVGRSIAVIIPEDRQDEEPGLLKHIVAGERIAHYESVRVRKDGSTCHVSLTVSPVRDQRGVVIGAAKIVRDITERKRAEEEIQIQRLRVFKATIRTVQDIVNNLLNGFQLVRLEGEGHLPAELLTLVDRMVQEAGVKLKTLGDLETVTEKEMAVGTGIDYPGAGS